MNKSSRNRGFALFDLLAAMVLFSVIGIILFNVVGMISRSQQSIMVQENKTATGLLMTRDLERYMSEFVPTSASYCDAEFTCILLTKDVEVSYDPITETIIRTVLSPAEEVQILYNGTDLTYDITLIDNRVYPFDASTRMEIVSNAFSTDIFIYISLSDRYGKVDEFIALYSIPS